jgi:hypothetical protein
VKAVDKAPWELAAHDISAQLGLPADFKLRVIR